MRTVYFDVTSGASGDMILASLVDLGAPLDRLQADLAKLPIPELSIGVEKVRRGGFQCAHMQLSWDTPDSYRHLPDILDTIAKGGYSERVNQRCRTVLERLADAEAEAHGIPVEKVHFHEIGAVDTIVDVAGAALCLEYLDVERVCFSTLTVGHGTVKTAHGEMSAPVPATTRMIQGLKVRGLDIPTEILTPTGSAILTSLGEQVAGLPDGAVAGTGSGCGDREFEGHANLLRTILIDTSDSARADSPTEVCVLESDMDHVSGEVMAFTAEECLAGGALDVTWMPVVMKKGRPGYRLTVLCEAGLQGALTETVMRHTRTLGVRWHLAHRAVASRSAEQDEVDGVAVQVKRCNAAGQEFTKLEFDSLAEVARTTGKSLLQVLEEYIRHAGGTTG